MPQQPEPTEDFLPVTGKILRNFLQAVIFLAHRNQIVVKA
jgi:hypothetical protein